MGMSQMLVYLFFNRLLSRILERDYSYIAKVGSTKAF